MAEPVVAVVPEPAGRVQCFLWKGELEPAQHIKKGMQAELECTFRDYHDLLRGRTAVLNDCSVLK